MRSPESLAGSMCLGRLCLVASSIWCVTAAARLGPTFDEPLYITRGLERWRTGSHAGCSASARCRCRPTLTRCRSIGPSVGADNRGT